MKMCRKRKRRRKRVGRREELGDLCCDMAEWEVGHGVLPVRLPPEHLLGHLGQGWTIKKEKIDNK